MLFLRLSRLLSLLLLLQLSSTLSLFRLYCRHHLFLLTFTVIVCSGHQPLSPLLLTLSPVITELVDVLSEDLPSKLPPTHDTQHAIELVSRASLPDLPHHRMDPITPIELNEQVDELLLEKKQ